MSNHIGVFGKSFSEISKGYDLLRQQGSGRASSLYNSISGVSEIDGNLFSKDELKKVADFHKELQSGATRAQAYNNNIKGCRSEVKQLSLNVAQGTQSMEGIQQATAKSSIAMRGLSTALSMVGNMLLSLGASLVVNGLINFVTDAINAEKEFREESIKTAQASSEEFENIAGLYSTYSQMSLAYKEGTSSKQELTTATDALLSALGYEHSDIAALINDYGDLGSAIDGVTLKALNEKLPELNAGVTSALKELRLAIDEEAEHMFSDDSELVLSYSGISTKVEEVLKDYVKIVEDTGWSDSVAELFGLKRGKDYKTIFNLDGINLKTDEGIIEYYNRLTEARNKAYEASQNGDYTLDVLNADTNYQAIIKELSRIEEKYKTVFDSVKNYNDALSEYSYLEYTNENGIPKTTEDFNNLKKAMIDSGNAALQSGEQTKMYDESIKSMNDSIDDFLASKSELSNFTSLNELFNQKQGLNSSFNFDDIKKAVDEYKNLGNELSKLNTDSPSLPLANVVKNTKESGKELAEYAQSFGLTSDKLVESYDKLQKQFSGNDEVSKWYNKLSAYNKSLVFDITLRADNTGLWSLERWQEELHQVDKVGKTTEEQMESLNAIFEDTSDEGFTAGVKKDIDSINGLRDAIKTVNGMTQQDRLNLAMTIPELMPYVADAELFKQKLNELYKASQKGLDDRFQGQLDSLKETAPAAYEVLDRLKTSLDNLYNSDFNFDISDEIASFNNLWSAMSESVSATGLTVDSIANLKNRYGELASFSPDELFEKTVNGIHLNTSALRELEGEYDKQKKSEINNQLKTLVNQYEDLGRKINETTDASKKAELVAQQNYLQNQIDEVSTLAAQYDGLTSSYNEWQKAQSATDERNMFEQISNNAEKVQDLIDSGWVSDQEVLAFTQMMTDEDLSSKSIEYILDMYEKGLPTIQKFFDGSTEGLGQFLDTAKEVSDELGKSWVQIDENGQYTFDFGVGGDKDLADAINQMTDLQMSTQQVQILLRALSDAGFDIHLDSDKSGIEGLQRLKTEAEKANDKLLDLGKTNIKFNFEEDTIGNVQAEITSAKKLLDQFKNDKGEIDFNLEGAEEAKTILQTLIRQKQILTDRSLGDNNIFNIDISGLDSKLADAVELMRQYHTAFNSLEENIVIGADTTDAQNNLTQLAIKLGEIPDSTLTTLGIDASQFRADLNEITSTQAEVDVKANLDTTALGGVNNAIGGASEKVITLVPDSKQVDNETAKEDGGQRTVDYNADTSGLTGVQSSTYGGTRTVYYKPDTTAVDYASSQLALNPITIPVNYSKGEGKADGTAWAYGSIGGVAFKSGNWGTKDSGYALGGELGQELLVRDGRYSIIGENGAEFFHYKKNDIIFNAEQTKDLLENGRITRGKRRGKAFTNGTVEGLAFSNGNGTLKRVESSSSDTYDSSDNSDLNSSFKDTSDNIDESTESAKEFEETIDWIEIKISRIEQVISDLGKTSENVYKKWVDRNDALRKDISKTTEEIDIQKKAYDRYIQEANSVGLAEDVAKDVREGKIDITKITDEDLSKQIKEYQQWYDKALNCKYAVTDLEESISKLYDTAFENIQTRFDFVLSNIENNKNEIQEYISQTENQGYFVSTKLYDSLGEREKNTIIQLKREREQLIEAMDTAVNTGAIKKGSEAWNKMSQEIANVTLEIEKSHTKLSEYAKTIREIKWDIFDTIEKRVSNITTETDFLINLLSNSKLFDKRGAFSYEGTATVGLHAVDYNTYMSQADTYAKAVRDLNEEISNDPDNKVLIERRDELLKAQQENILAAEKEKQAMKSLVEEGIKIELDNLKDLIDKKKDALDSEKDLYEYRKKTKEQTKEIADLEKQMAAYANDNSEETRTTVQKLKVSLADAKENLEETQYDKYISDTKAVLDQFYNDYETVINKRLDNIDRLIREMIQSTNSQSGEIASVIYNYSDRVGYAMSKSNEQIWGAAYKSIQDESNQRFEQMKTTVDGLIANGFISQADGQEIVRLLGNGDVTQVKSVVDGIKDLLNNGKIGTDVANTLMGNLVTKTEIETAVKSLDLVSQLQSSGVLSNEKAEELKNAIMDTNTGISASVGTTLTTLLNDKNIDFKQGSDLLNAIQGSNTSGVVDKLTAIETLYNQGLLTDSEKTSLIDGIVTGDATNSQAIVQRLWMNEQADQKSLSSIISAFGGTNGNLGQIQLALSSVKDAYIKGKLTQEEAEKIFGSIINGDGSALKGMSQKLVDALGEDTLKDVILAITGEKSEQIQKALDTINYLEKENKLDSEWKRDTIDALLSGDKTALNKSIETLRAAVESGQTQGNNISSLLSLLSRSVERPINVVSPEINASSLMPVVSTYSEEFKNALVGVVGKDSVLIHAITTVTDAINKITISTSERRIGDVNGGDGDGLVNVRDAAYIAAMLAIGKKDNVDSYYGDMDQDKKISVRDAARIARTLAERGYAKGIKKISENQFAWTQEDGEEYIIRPSDGAILTPLARNDSVITASASNNIWNMANDPEKFIKDNIGIVSSNIPNNTIQSTVSYNSGDMQIVLPNVQNYQDFKYALQHDKNFEGFVRSITVDKLFGKSSLRKYKM